MNDATKTDLFFWLLYVPVAIIVTPFLVIIEVLDNLGKGKLFDFK